MASGECAHTEKGVSDFEEGLTVTSASSHYADKIREWEPTRHPTSNTSKRGKRREGERGRNCKHACNSARANQNVMSLRSVADEAGDSVRPPPGEEICVRVKKDAISLAILLPRSDGGRGTAIEQSQIKSLGARRCLNDPGRVGSVRSCRPGECAQVASPGPNFASKARWDNPDRSYHLQSQFQN